MSILGSGPTRTKYDEPDTVGEWFNRGRTVRDKDWGRLYHQGLEDYAEAARRIRGALKVEGWSDSVEIDGLELSPDEVFRVGANELRRRGLQVRA